MGENNLDTIMEYPLKDVVREVLNQLQPWQVARIRAALKPHWADGRYGTWSHDDYLLKDCFEEGETKVIIVRDTHWGEDFEDLIKHLRCRLCKEEFPHDEGITDNRYSHLFGRCDVSATLRKQARNESEYRQLINGVLNGTDGITT